MQPLDNAGTTPPGIYQALKSGGNVFDPATQVASGFGPLGTIAAIDLDHDIDGYEDASFTVPYSDEIQTLTGSFGGLNTNPASPNSANTVAGSNPRQQVVADLNLDGNDDVATSSYGFNALAVARSAGNGTIALDPNSPFALPPIGALPFFPDSVAVGDFNGDGGPGPGELQQRSGRRTNSQGPRHRRAARPARPLGDAGVDRLPGHRSERAIALPRRQSQERRVGTDSAHRRLVRRRSLRLRERKLRHSRRRIRAPSARRGMRPQRVLRPHREGCLFQQRHPHFQRLHRQDGQPESAGPVRPPPRSTRTKASSARSSPVTSRTRRPSRSPSPRTVAPISTSGHRNSTDSTPSTSASPPRPVRATSRPAAPARSR